MTLRTCGHGEPIGLFCSACDAMRRSMEEIEAEDARHVEPRELPPRRPSRWPAWLERSLARGRR